MQDFLRGLYRVLHTRHYRSIGATRYGCEWLDRAAIERFRLVEYRPRNQLGSYLDCEAAPTEALQELGGGMAWHLLQKLSAASQSD